jgi:hypothetical protein
MADSKISALPTATTPLAGTEILPIVQSGATDKVSVANLTAGRAVSALSYASATGATFATSSGSVLIGTTALSLSTTATTPLVIQGQALLGVSNQTNNANKDFRILSGSYVNNAITIISASGQLSANNISYGGNTGAGEPATNHLFFTGTAGTLGAGTERMRIDSSGNVGIGTSSPSASAILDAQSTTKGVRMPNMTTAQKTAISSPAAGLMVFDTTLSKLSVYSGIAWETVTSV